MRPDQGPAGHTGAEHADSGIVRLCASDVPFLAGELGALLTDAVDGGSSVGFLAPLDPAEAAAWWEGLGPEVAAGRIALWAAHDGDRVLGTVQLRMGAMPNAHHRAEVAKLVVRRDARGRGLGRALLTTAEKAAAEAGLPLLVLDTETGSPAERLYRSAGLTEAGTIPDYAADTAGVLRSTTLFHKSPG